MIYIAYLNNLLVIIFLTGLMSIHEVYIDTLLGVLLMVSVLAGLLTVPFLENVNKF